MTLLRGKVVSGEGSYAYWIAKLQPYYRSKTGMTLFPGTLNVRLDHPYILPAECVIRLEKEEYGGLVSVSIVPCRVLARQAFILRPDLRGEVTAHDVAERLATLEVATDVKLRDVHDLKDGDEVAVEVPMWSGSSADGSTVS